MRPLRWSVALKELYVFDEEFIMLEESKNPKINCPFDCDWNGTRIDFVNEHALTCIKGIYPCINGCGHYALKGMHDDCELMPIDCDLCHNKIIKKHISYHKELECKYRLIKCKGCSTIMTFLSLQLHNQMCPGRLIQCNNCNQSIKASYYQTHKMNDCVNRLVKCRSVS